MSNTPQTEAMRLAGVLDSDEFDLSVSGRKSAAAELRRLDAIEQRYNEMMANPCPEWDGKAYMQAIANLRAQLAKAVASKCELLRVLDMLLKYTKSCEGLLNCKPAGQIQIAESAIAKETGEADGNHKT